MFPHCSSSLLTDDSDCSTDGQENNPPQTMKNQVGQDFLNNPRKRPRPRGPSEAAKAINNLPVPAPDFDLSQCISLNVGGSLFLTTVSTLHSIPDSYFTARFAQGHAFADSAVPSWFIDRDGTHFRFILNYLRDRSFSLEFPSLSTLKEILAEARFFSLTGLVREVENKIQETLERERERDMDRRERKMRRNQPVMERSHSDQPCLGRSEPLAFLSAPLVRVSSQPLAGPFDFTVDAEF